jgi:vacuolar iron transporter family protein
MDEGISAIDNPLPTARHSEPHHLLRRLNWLRAGVLGANDGIVSVAGVVIGVAAATTNRTDITIAGLAALLAGAVSMALGEYVSVSTQRDTENGILDRERHELLTQPGDEQEELAMIYRNKGLSEATAKLVAQELTDHDAFAAHADAELGINPNTLANPWQAALHSPYWRSFSPHPPGAYLSQSQRCCSPW